MEVKLLSYTKDAEKLCAAAAHSCYSQDSASEILDKIEEKNWARMLEAPLNMGHQSVIEHACYTFSIEGVSRALTHQLVRHRIASFSQKSQRYVSTDKPDYVVPRTIAQDEEAEKRFRDLMDEIWKEYAYLSKKVPIEDARYVLPNATTTHITVTMNARELWHFFSLRCCNRCYDKDTQVLTKRGWIHFEDLVEGDLFYSLNPKTKECDFVPARSFFSMNYRGPMVHVHSQSIDLLVTPNHKNLVSYSYDNKDFKLDDAINALQRKRVLMKKNCKPINGIIADFFTIPELVTERNNQFQSWKMIHPSRTVPIRDLFRFVGMYISDGCALRAGDHYNVVISEGDPLLVEKYRLILERLTPHAILVQKDRNAYKITVHDRLLYELLKPLGKAMEKHIPDFVWDFDSSILECLYEGLSDGDMRKAETGIQYSTISKRLAGDLQRLLLHIGYSGTIGEVERDNQSSFLYQDAIGRDGSMGEIGHRNIEYSVTVNKSKNEPIIKSEKQNPFSMVEYRDKIYCVELERNHTLYIRRNGKCVWSGNSQWELREMADKMLMEAREVSPLIFKNAGPACLRGKCPEGKMSCGKPRTELLKK